MRKQDRPGKLHRVAPDPTPGKFDDLLREIEKEAVPGRLLDLARQLQAALAERRGPGDHEGGPAET